MNSIRVVGVIPARMAASRFPGKPLVNILGIPLVEHVRRRALLSNIDEVYVATCDEEIARVTEGFGGKSIMTASTHERCTDRVEEAVRSIDADIVVILQGDEPLLIPEVINTLVQSIKEHPEVLCTNLLSIIREDSDLFSTDVVKAVVDIENFIMYFSRLPIPYQRVKDDYTFYRQTGLSAFRKEFLIKYSHLSPTPKEIAESIDFLRILEHRYSIRGVISEQVTAGIDRERDVQIVEDILKTDVLQNAILQKIL